VRKGEQVIWGTAALIAASALYLGYAVYNAPPELMPTFQEESPEAARGELVYRKNNCSACHRIWDLGGSKGGPLDGVGSRRDPDWLTRYLSSDNPQVMLPSTQKKIYQMPAFTMIRGTDLEDLVAFLASLKERAPAGRAGEVVPNNGEPGA
jgi:mono/diheme cytochrome c family protein